MFNIKDNCIEELTTHELLLWNFNDVSLKMSEQKHNIIGCGLNQWI